MLRALMRPRSPSAVFTTEQHISRTGRAAHPSAIALVQELNTTEWCLGSDPTSHVVLQVPTTANDPPWINFCHATIYPDPDTNALHLYNTSATVFRIGQIYDAKDGGAAQTPRLVERTHNVVLARGSWHVQLARDLEFEIEVLHANPSDGPESYTTPLLPSPSQSPVPKTSRPSPPDESIPPLPQEPALPLPGDSQSSLPNKSPPSKSPLSLVTTATPQSPSLEKQQSSRLGQGGKRAALQALELGTPKQEVPAIAGQRICREDHRKPQLQNSFRQSEPIQTKGLSIVTRVTHGNNVVVIKKPRKGDVRRNARVWQTERLALTILRHPNIIRLITSNAQDLSLTMEDGGLDLDKFCHGSPVRSKQFMLRLVGTLAGGLDDMFCLIR